MSHPILIQYKDMIGLLKEYNYDASGIDVFLNSLFNKGYVIGINQRNGEIIRDLKTLKKKLQERILFFRKNRIFLIPHPEEFRLKSKKYDFH